MLWRFMANSKLHTCENGLQIVTENIPGVKTVAMNWGVQAGTAMGASDGESVVVHELIQRGVQRYNAKEHANALSDLGIQKSVHCGVEFVRLTSVLLGNRFEDALPLLGSYFTAASLPETELQACKNLCVQAISGLKDNPSHTAAIELHKHHLPSPFNRSSYGTSECVEQTTIEDVRSAYGTLYSPSKSILVVTGDIHHEQVVEQVLQFSNDWRGEKIPVPTKTPSTRGIHFIEQDTSQTHITFAFDAPHATEPESILESFAIAIFGGSTSGRLFTEVRQRRSLCYSVGARYVPSKDRSLVCVSAGTTPERADETVRVCLDELSTLKMGVTADEFTRAKQQLKSRTVMRGESTSARASALWGDQFVLEKTRTLQEKLDEIEQTTLEEVNTWLGKMLIGSMTFVAVGPKSFELHPDALKLD